MEQNVLKERLMNKDDKNRHFVLLTGSVPKLDMHESKQFLSGQFVHNEVREGKFQSIF
jgi:hypothetical protein